MTELHLPWLELAVLLPLIGSVFVGGKRNPDLARRKSLLISGATLLCTVGAWRDFITLETFEAHDAWDVLHSILHRDFFVIDELSAPLIPLSALLYFLTMLTTLRTKVKRFSFSLTLLGESLLLATLACKDPLWIVCLLSVAVLPPWIELRRRKRPTRVFALHMSLFVVLLFCGQLLATFTGKDGTPSLLAVVLLGIALLLRSGVVPVHCWMTDLFEHASFGTALLFVTPMAGAYGTMRLLVPIAPDWVLHHVSLLSLITAIYAAAMSLVQTEARRFFCYLFLSNASLVLVGLETATPIGLTGALCVWASVGLSLGGFGLTLRSVESRTGRLSLGEYHGLNEQMPMLAAFFLLTGLASIGFPGTIGFIGVELLVEGAVQVSPWVGAIVVVAAALNSLAVMYAYFHVFTGHRHAATIDLRCRMPERIGILVLTLLILGGGLYPQPGVASRFHAASELMAARNQTFPPENPAGEHPQGSPNSDQHHQAAAQAPVARQWALFQ